MLLSQLGALYDFQNLLSLYGNFNSHQKFHFSVFFSLVYHAVHMHTMNWLKNWLKKDFLRKKNAFLVFA